LTQAQGGQCWAAADAGGERGCNRCFADVHIRRADGEEVFLNNAILENGHAVPMGAEEMADWTP
jgi:hypothetical protein